MQVRDEVVKLIFAVYPRWSGDLDEALDYDSLLVLEIILSLEETFGIVEFEDALKEIRTPRQLIEHVEGELERQHGTANDKQAPA